MKPSMLGLFLLFLILAPFLAFLIFFNIAAFSFAKLGLTPDGAVLLFALILIGSVVNIPITRKKLVVKEPVPLTLPFIFYYPPRVKEQIIAVNLGGAVIPSVFALYLLLTHAPVVPTLISVFIVTLVTRKLARPVQGVGIVIPTFIPPVIAGLCALILSPEVAPPVAYISGVWGTLIGADLLNLNKMHHLGTHMLSIGGAGIFDGILLVGIISSLIS